MKETLFSIGWNSKLINVFLVSALIESLSFSPQGRPILGFFTGKKNKNYSHQIGGYSEDYWQFKQHWHDSTGWRSVPDPQPRGCLVISSLCSRPAPFGWKRCIVSLQQLACLHPILSFSSPPSDRYSYPLTAKTSFLPGRQRSAVFTLARRGAARSAALLSGLGKHSWWARQPLSILFFF